MGFFLRKSFKAGPVRLNLSKSGIGVSTGVKGARVGINSKGKAYIAGGKGAIRYRKTIGSSDSRTKLDYNSSQTTLQDEVFIDTKVTYPNNIHKSNLNVGSIPETPKEITYRKMFYIIGSIALLFSLASSVWLVISIVSFIIAIIRSKMHKKLKSQIEQAQINQKNLLNSIENKLSFEQHIYTGMSGDINEQLKNYYNFATLHALFLSVFEDHDGIAIDKIQQIKQSIGADERIYTTAKLRAFRDVFNFYIEDLKLDEDEEHSLLKAIDVLNIDKDIISDELKTVNKMSQLRKEINKDLSPIQTDLNLKNEECYYKTEARIIKEKILKRRTVEGVKVKEVGYTIDREGILYITNKRIILVGSGTYSTKIDKILDIIVTPENNTVEVQLMGAKLLSFIPLPMQLY